MSDIKQLLSNAKTIAVVGLSNKPDRASYGVAEYMQRAGYRIIPVNPVLTEPVLGEQPVASLRDINEPIDIVDIFRRAEDVPPVVEEAIAVGAKAVWMQLGIVNQEAAAAAEAAGLEVVMDKCIKVEHMQQ
ncbi:CoA-binding protein [Herpetosiphon geysericola]|uniref:CoA-binding protein n=1 Tax=Herpetosiphon geysericola TaxID=70996 RepID=A0A0P6YJY3_9CHLR|nr:CoA-binding protein [Herpetosiphon geysericola]KPL85478.1 CoA-binding protein [Herpetosiphon geysericola]